MFWEYAKMRTKLLDSCYGSWVNTAAHTIFMSRSGEEAPGRGKQRPVRELTSLGLTEREAEVLVWIARGKGNYEIGVILGAKPRTICKHVEHILSKLNVENRTAAAAVAFAMCSQLAISFRARSVL